MEVVTRVVYVDDKDRRYHFLCALRAALGWSVPIQTKLVTDSEWEACYMARDCPACGAFISED